MEINYDVMYDINMYIFIRLHMRVKGHHHYCGVCFARPISKSVLQPGSCWVLRLFNELVPLPEYSNVVLVYFLFAITH